MPLKPPMRRFRVALSGSISLILITSPSSRQITPTGAGNLLRRARSTGTRCVGAAVTIMTGRVPAYQPITRRTKPAIRSTMIAPIMAKTMSPTIDPPE